MTATTAVVDYRGDMRMCCNIYPDTIDAAQYTVGNLTTAAFAQLWNGPAMARYRAAHAAADWSISPACRTCTQALPETRR